MRHGVHAGLSLHSPTTQVVRGFAAGDIVAVPAPDALVVYVEPVERQNRTLELSLLKKRVRCGRGRHGDDVDRHLVCWRIGGGQSGQTETRAG